MEEISEGIRVVSRGDIIDLAREIFRPEVMALTLLGNVEKISLDLRL
jgi:predicted Zn-dependent peptidase